MRLNPVRKPEGLRGDAESVRAELVRARESSLGRRIWPAREVARTAPRRRHGLFNATKAATSLHRLRMEVVELDGPNASEPARDPPRRLSST